MVFSLKRVICYVKQEMILLTIVDDHPIGTVDLKRSLLKVIQHRSVSIKIRPFVIDFGFLLIFIFIVLQRRKKGRGGLWTIKRRRKKIAVIKPHTPRGVWKTKQIF